jgi:hypothetical protein
VVGVLTESQWHAWAKQPHIPFSLEVDANE